MALTPEQESLRQERQPLTDALGVEPRGKTCRCPFHDDKHPSASVFEDSQGVYRFKCHTCDWSGDVFDVRARVEGRQLGDVLKDGRPEQATPNYYPSLESIVRTYSNVEQVYKYTNPETDRIDLAVIRYQPNGHKQFAQCSPNGRGWLKTRPEGKMPLYNRKRAMESESVVVVEGEKAVHALHDIGLVAVTSPMGAGKASLADWTPLKGKTVYLWPDNDPVGANGRSPGIEHMKDVQKILEPMECCLYWLDPSGFGLPPKGDAVDFLRMNGGSRSDKNIAVKLLLDEAQPLGTSRDLETRLNAIISGEWSNIEFPWVMISSEAQALLPDSITALCGDPGAAKSLFMLEAFCYWHMAGEKVALFMLEDDRTYHLHRVLAQLDDNAYLTQMDWVKSHGDEATFAYQKHKAVLNTFGRVLYDAPDKQVTLDDLADWFEERCKEGAKICGIDPVTAAQATDAPWISDQRFIFRVKEIAKRYHARLIYVIHPRIANGKMGPSLSRMAGGAAYARFSHSVFWLLFHDKVLKSKVYSDYTGTVISSHERTMKITKARNGRGAGKDIAFRLNPETLKFDECGSIVEPHIKEIEP